VDVVSARLQSAYPDSNTGKGLNVSPLQSSLVDSYDEMLLTLMAAIGLVLLIACLNVAGLLVARGAGRAEELSVKAAIGASAGRLIRQLLSESLLLAGAAGILGTLLAVGLQQVALEILSLEYVGVTELGLSGSMLTFALLLSLGTIMVSGLIPAWVGSRASPAEGLTSSPGSTQSGGHFGIQGGLVALQVACSLTLLIGSGLLVKSFVRLAEVDPGFQPDGLFTARVSIPFTQYLMPQTRLRFLADLVEGVHEIPGVQAVGAAHLLPMTDIVSQPVATYDPENPPIGLGEQVITEHRQVLPGFFEAMGITQLAGRDFTDQDCENQEPVIIINRTMAQGFFGEENPIGRSVSVDLGRGEASLPTVIGVVGNVQMLALDQEPVPQMYSPAGLYNVAGRWSIAVRTYGDPADFTDPIRQILRRIDPDVPLIHVSTMNEALARAVATPRVLMTSLSLFSTMALGLTILGLYAMLAFYVARKVREIGIRLAVGAAPRRIIALVLKRGMILVAAGLAFGLGTAIILTRFLQAHLYRVEATDPPTFGLVCLGLLSIAFLACLVPARRAARGDPVRALRSE
jgi:putative ABC transport system permease protein